MEENKTGQQEEISLAEIFKALLRKAKILIIALLIGVIVGASFGVVKTVDVKYYGSRVVFYVNPKMDDASTTENNSQYGVYGAYGLHVMDNMVTLLNSELFAERLTLNAEGLPLDKDGRLLVDNAELQALVNDAQAKNVVAETAKTAVEEAEEAVETAKEELTLAEQELSKANSEKKISEEELSLAVSNREYLAIRLTTLWQRAGGTGEFGVPEEFPFTSNELTENYTSLYSEWTTVIDTCATLNTKLTEATEKIYNTVDGKQTLRDAAALDVQNKNKALKEKKEESIEKLAAAQEATEKAVDKWQTMDVYTELVEQNKESVSFSYYDEDEKPEDLEDLARSFIYVNISVLNDKAAAEELYQKVLEIVPIFVSENMAVPSGYSGTKCRRITRDDGIQQTNEGYVLSTAVKYGLLMGLVAFAVACVAVVLLDRSDKRLRNYEQTMYSFNVPVLGVIPNIERDEEEKRKGERV